QSFPKNDRRVVRWQERYMKSLLWRCLIISASMISHPALAQSIVQAGEVSPATIAAIDDALDDARSAPRGARQRVEQTLAQLESLVTKYPDSAIVHMMMGRALILHDCALGGNNCSVR